MKNVYKKSTKVLLLLITAATGLINYAMEPANLGAIQQLLHGHAKALTILGWAVGVYALFHDPKKVPVKVSKK